MDYFTIKQQYYTGNFEQALQEVAKHNKVQDDTLLFYKGKCLVALGKYESMGEDDILSNAFDKYAAFLSSKKLNELEQISSGIGSLYVLNLLASAQAINGDFDAALKTCNVGLDSEEEHGRSELVLLTVQIALLDKQYSMASAVLQHHASTRENYSNDDEIIINLAESYVNFATGKEVTGSNFYFYEELCQTFPSWKTQLGLLCLHLQQSHIPEAQSIIELLESEYYQQQAEYARIYTPDLLANKITLTIMQGEKADDLRSELRDLKPEHPLCRDYQANNVKFDEIVARYA
ncbi:LAFE_0B04192g1_1 [Lachancea fermentati]|uniref:Coatomer subunit epsilon n=1 Tax=Lachancea fermentati TaxID=4955 RepID=A0A1G4M7T0_LACFM|nr:LAFE_0B04192g1_1 [Lachancea fermentati]